MKILLIDPRCVDGSNLYFYTTGLVSGLSNGSDVTLVSNYFCELPEKLDCVHKKWFYPFSQKMKDGKIRKALRGVEYIFAYLEVLILASNSKYDVIHIEWPIVYKLDRIFWSILKQKCKILSIKAHNILPHSTGMRHKDVFADLYKIADVVEVHGENMRKEFCCLFPESKDKVIIQRHGILLNEDVGYNADKISKEIKETVEKYNRVYLFCGRIDKDKGVNRLVKIWKSDLQFSGSLLIIAGKKDEAYVEFADVENEIRSCKNLIYLPGFIDRDTFNYLMSNSSLIVLPYLRGSMSGVAFTAACFSKPILSTIFGVIEEYITDGKNGFLVNNDDQALKEKLLDIDCYTTNVELQNVGVLMRESFIKNYSWDKIGEKLMQCFVMETNR